MKMIWLPYGRNGKLRWCPAMCSQAPRPSTRSTRPLTRAGFAGSGALGPASFVCRCVGRCVAPRCRCVEAEGPGPAGAREAPARAAWVPRTAWVAAYRWVAGAGAGAPPPLRPPGPAPGGCAGRGAGRRSGWKSSSLSSSVGVVGVGCVAAAAPIPARRPTGGSAARPRPPGPRLLL